MVRTYGKKHPDWNEILPWKEFIVQRDDETLKPVLQRSKALRVFRTEGKMPSGICGTALDKVAQRCKFCQHCFSGEYPAQVQIESL
jgi:hypothetical protein